jgi:hypothetical protein
VLAVIAWIGWSGRPGPELARPTARAVVAEPAMSATPTTRSAPTTTPSATPMSEASPSFEPTRSPLPRTLLDQSLSAPSALGDDQFALFARFDGRRYLGLLRETASGDLRAVMRLPRPPQTASRIRLVQLWTRDERKNYMVVDRWRLDLPAKSGVEGRETLLEAEVEPDPEMSGAPRLVRTGYSIEARTQTESGLTFVVVDVTVTR